MHAHARKARKRACMFLYLVIFLNGAKLGLMKKIKVGREGPMYTHNNCRTSASVRGRTGNIKVKRASVLDLISQATYIRYEKFKKAPPSH